MKAGKDVSHSEKIALEDGMAELWPRGVSIQDWMEPNVKIAIFDDIELYHPRLIARVLGLENNPALARSFPGYAGSSKIYHLDRWSCPEADLINRRAIELFKRTLATKQAVVDLSWANIYRESDYCLPHSHVRATGSIVYFLDLALNDDTDADAVGTGRFCFADPRLKVCCQEEPHAMTTPVGPVARNGMMIMFPGKLVHMVDVFRRPGPRITLAWNINERAVPGFALPDSSLA